MGIDIDLFLKFAYKWKGLEKINIQNEVTKTQKDEHGMYSLLSRYQL